MCSTSGRSSKEHECSASIPRIRSTILPTSRSLYAAWKAAFSEVESSSTCYYIASSRAWLDDLATDVDVLGELKMAFEEDEATLSKQMQSCLVVVAMI